MLWWSSHFHKPEGEKKRGLWLHPSYSGHHLPSRCEQIPICVRPSHLTLAYLFLWDPVVEDAESSAHRFLGWFLQTKPQCLPHLWFSLWVLPVRTAMCPSMGEYVRIFAWHPGRWRHSCLCWGDTLRASHKVLVVYRAGSAQIVMAFTERRCTDRGDLDLPQFLSVILTKGFFPFVLALAQV